ncbi:MAG TPA: DUF3237 domain-containing protein [Candidatus Binatia bacterium]|jgi:hypothetical protein|nr:DUF3237 domain-containing protein [Candidatus Binatia bacterium]
MNLEYEFTYRATFKEGVEIGPGPFGRRIAVEVTGGSFEGKRLKGTLLGGGGDWILVGPDGFGRLDVRIQMRTDDGALIYLAYLGLLEMNAKVQQALATETAGTDWGDQYLRSAPRMESGDPRYAWLSQSLFVSEGRLLPGRVVEYRVYRVT